MSWQALNWCAALHHVTGSRRALLWAMANRHNAKTGLITMGLSSIADESGLSRSAAHRHLKSLESDGLIQTLIPGAGTRTAAYVLPVLASHSGGTQAEVASVPLVTGSSDLASHSEDLASHPGWDETNKQPEVQPRAGGAAADAAAPRSGQPATVPDWRAALNGQGPVARPVSADRDNLSPLATEPVPVARPVSAATAKARQAAPDPAARHPRTANPSPATENAIPRPVVQADTARELDPAQATRRRGRYEQRGRKGRRGREPPARCHRSPVTFVVAKVDHPPTKETP